MNGLYEKILWAVLGWLFGLFAPLIVDLSRTRRAVRAMEAALVIELDELQIRLAENAFHIANYLGAFDRDLIRWLLSSYQIYQGLYASPETVKILEGALQEDDTNLTHVNQQRTHGTGPAIRLRTFAAPLLESAMPLLPYFGRETQQKLLEIRTLLRFLDEDKDEHFEQIKLLQANRGSTPSPILDNIERILRHTLKTSRSTSDFAQAIVILLRGV